MSGSKRTLNLLGQVRPPQSDIGACGAANTPRAHAVVGEGVPPPPRSPSLSTGYGWRDVHDDLERGNYAGSYGWDNAAYWGIAEQKAGVDLTEWYKTKTEAEFYLPEFKELIDDPETQRDWDRIATFDPMGLYAHPPTIAACRAHLDLPELKDLPVDGVIVDANREILTSKCAVYYAWNLPALSARLEMDEWQLRRALHKYSRDDRLLDPKVRTYIPAVGGCTVYTFGDARKIRDPKTELVLRVHDECIGSDVFGSDICSCRPYLIFALRQAVECAQRGGVGVVVYYRKEGRSLGEVIKFRVYNARINQEGGDVADNYFHQTESIAGIRDARFQTMMPDVLNWMGIRRVDWLCSMSNEKYEAIVGAGIRVMQRVSLPEDYIKDSMRVELDAKIASGYHSDTVEKDSIASELAGLGVIRAQAQRLYDLGVKGELEYFSFD
jgi:GTP cyclohydrolase II